MGWCALFSRTMAATRGASALSSTSLVGACAALLLALRVVNFVHSSGELRHLENINAYSGRCTRHNGEHRGFEDFAVFDGGQLVSLASDHSHFAFKWGVSMRDRLKVTKGAHAVHAKVLRGGKWRSFELRGVPSDFAPHGLAAWGRLSGGTLLVVNHRTTHDTLEIFATLPHGARHQSSHAHPLLYNVNDCSFATARLVFCTNWRSHETGTVMDAVEVYGQQPWSNVVACELGKLTHCVLAADGLQMANGIEVIGEHVAVVSSLEPAIRVYSRAPAARASDARASDARAPDARLELLYKINTRSACDNLVRTTGARKFHQRALHAPPRVGPLRRHG